MVSELLSWASKKTEVITPAVERSYSGGGEFAMQASTAIYSGLIRITAHAVYIRQRKLAGMHRGLEWWRQIVHEYRAQSVYSNRARLYKLENFTRCKDIAELRRAMGPWESELNQALEEGTDGDFRPVGERFRYDCLMKLVPAEMKDRLEN